MYDLGPGVVTADGWDVTEGWPPWTGVDDTETRFADTDIALET